MAKCSIETNLLFNISKTKFIVITTNQMSAQHKFEDEQFMICFNNMTLERVINLKLFGVTLGEKSILIKHISPQLKNCCSYLLFDFYSCFKISYKSSAKAK